MTIARTTGRRAGAIAGAVGLCLMLTSLPAPAQEFQWTMATWGGGLWREMGGVNFANRVEFLTEGRVKIEVATPGMMGDPLRITETVQNGIAEVGLQWPAYDVGRDVAGVPFAGWSGGLTPEEYMLWLFNEGGAELLRQWREEEYGVVSIPCNLVETEIFLHAHKPVRTLEDFQGLRMRTSGAWAEIASNLGAITVVLPGAEVFDALERGVVDAIEWGGPGTNLNAGFHTIAKYIIVPGVHQPGNLNECMFNKNAWDQLSERDQELIELAGKLNTYETFLAYAKDDIPAWEELTARDDVEFIELDESFMAAARQASFDWAEAKAEENEWFKRVYESQRALQEKLRRWQEFRLPIGAAHEK